MGAVGSGQDGMAGPQMAPTASPSPPKASGRLIESFDGPLVVTADLARQRALFEGVFGMTLTADQELDAEAVLALFGVRSRAARTVLLQTRDTGVGVRLVEFRPASGVIVREGARAIDSDCLKAIDFIVNDFDRAVSLLAESGFKTLGSPAEYASPEDGRITEGQVAGPDGVVCALLELHDTSPSKYVRVADRTFSEILGVSLPVSDRESALGFYRLTLGLATVISYEIPGRAFQPLMDSAEPPLLRGTNFGVSSRAPMIGVIHYGLPTSVFRSLRDRAVLPNRGLQALRFSVSSVDEVARRAAAAGLETSAPVAEAVLFPQGRVKSLLLRAPHGVLHHFTETLKA